MTSPPSFFFYGTSHSKGTLLLISVINGVRSTSTTASHVPPLSSLTGRPIASSPFFDSTRLPLRLRHDNDQPPDCSRSWVQKGTGSPLTWTDYLSLPTALASPDLRLMTNSDVFALDGSAYVLSNAGIIRRIPLQIHRNLSDIDRGHAAYLKYGDQWNPQSGVRTTMAEYNAGGYPEPTVWEDFLRRNFFGSNFGFPALANYEFKQFSIYDYTASTLELLLATDNDIYIARFDTTPPYFPTITSFDHVLSISYWDLERL